MDNPTFPTDFAIDFADQVEITDHRTVRKSNGGAYLVERDGLDDDVVAAIEANATESYFRLASFQKIAAVMPYEKAVIVFKNYIELNEEQVEALRIIAELTPAWLKGEITERLMEMMKRDPKSAAAIADIIIKAMDSQEGYDLKGKGKGASAVKSFYLELTGDSDA